MSKALQAVQLWNIIDMEVLLRLFLLLYFKRKALEILYEKNKYMCLLQFVVAENKVFFY